MMNCLANCGRGPIGRFRRGGGISPSWERPSSGRCRFLRYVIALCKPRPRSCLSRSLRRISPRAVSGFARSGGQHDALQVLVDETWRGRRWVVETDIANCFSAIPHDKLMQAVEERISDRTVLALVRAMLRAGVLEDGRVRREVTGTPQGGPLSPLLCNVYLHRLDRVWDTREHGVLVRYCDDLVVMCSTGRQAEDALARLTTVLARLGLELKAAKTRIAHLT